MRQSVKRQRLAVNKIKPKSLLTKLVIRRAKQLHPWQRFLFGLYIKTRRTEHLPDGIPYKVVVDLSTSLGQFVYGLNRPLILVDAQLKTYKARQLVARHEYEEWKTSLSVARHSKGSKASYGMQDSEAHRRALIREPHKKLLRALLEDEFSIPK